jgi:myo-inositol-1(or 4)-monophosphatase
VPLPGCEAEGRDSGLERACLAIATAVAAAAALAADGVGRGVRGEAGRDIKIDADFAADRIIHEELARRSSLPVLSEERAETASAPEGYGWIVDPVDGSVNFARQIPFACVSIGLWRGTEPILGVVHDLHRAEVFSGLIGSGAWMNGEPMHVSRIADRRRAVLCSGLPGVSAYGPAKLAAFTARAEAYKKVRLLGSAALSLAYVACGRVDAYAEDGIAIWDVAAGLALVRAAGGAVRYTALEDSQVGPAAYRLDVEADNGVLTAPVTE